MWGARIVFECPYRRTSSCNAPRSRGEPDTAALHRRPMPPLPNNAAQRSCHDCRGTSCGCPQCPHRPQCPRCGRCLQCLAIARDGCIAAALHRRIVLHCPATTSIVCIAFVGSQCETMRAPTRGAPTIVVWHWGALRAPPLRRLIASARRRVVASARRRVVASSRRPVVASKTGAMLHQRPLGLAVEDVHFVHIDHCL